MKHNTSGWSGPLRIQPGDRPTTVSAVNAASIRLPKPSFASILGWFGRRVPRPGAGEKASGGRAGGGGNGRKPPKQNRGGKWRGSGLWLRLFGIAFAVGIWALVAGAIVVGIYSYDLPSLSSLTATTRRPSVTLVSADGETIAAYGDVFGEPVTAESVPKYLPEAIIATEDRHFYSHYGLDPIGLLRAMVVDLRAGHFVQGGSTITQQLAENLFLTPERSIKRKI